MSNPWFRFYREFMNDPVIQSLAFEDQRHYVIILCLKCDGVLDRNITLSAKERIILRALGLDSVTGDEVKRRLLEVGLITKKWNPKGWEKRQYLSDSSTQRTRKYRKTKETGNVPGTVKERHGDAPETDTDTDTDKDIKTLEHFDTFWANYPRKTNKPKAEKAWKKVNNTDRQKAITDVLTRYKHTEKKYIPYPSSYLNGKMWEDEREEHTPSTQEEWLALGEQKGVKPKPGESMNDYINRVKAA